MTKRMTTLAILLALVIFSPFTAWAYDGPNDNLSAQERARIQREWADRGRWAELNPGKDPNILESEYKCITSELEMSAVDWSRTLMGEHDNCTAKGLMPIAQRMKFRAWQLTHFLAEGLKDAQVGKYTPAFEKFYNDYLLKLSSAQAHYETLRSGDTSTNVPQIYGAKGLGSMSALPTTPVNFEIQVLVVDPIVPEEGLYAGKALSMALISAYSWKGKIRISCGNLMGFVSDQIPTFRTQQTETVNTPPPSGGLILPPAGSLPPLQTEHRASSGGGCGKGCKISIGVGIAAAVTGAVLGALFSRQHQEQEVIIVNGVQQPTPVAPEGVKTGSLGPRPASVRGFSFSF